MERQADFGDKKIREAQTIRNLTRQNNLLLQEENRPVAIALFSQPDIIFHLGFDKVNLIEPNWYQNPNHPYLLAFLQIIEQMSNWDDLQSLQFLIADGEDSMLGLQVRLAREKLSIETPINQLENQWQTQTIYVYQN